MKRIVLYLLFALLLVSCGKQSQTLSELKSEYVTIDDSIRVHYKIWNESVDSDAKTICFVHGFGCDMNTWEKQFEAFRDGKDLQLVFIDLPGYGLSDKPHVEYTLDFFAHAIDEVLNVNSIKEAVFVGHSLGTPVCRHALLTTRINYLANHFKKFPKDFASRVGFLKMIGQRRRLLDYLKRTDKESYTAILKKLDLRK